MPTKTLYVKNSNIAWRARLMHKLVSFSQPLYKKLSRQRQASWDISVKQLLSYPINSLGRALGIFLQNHGYTLMAQFESHDVFHVLLAYKPRVLDEARMQYCLLGSGRRSLYTIGTCIVAGLVYPEFFLDFKSHYKRGKGLKDFSYWDFEAMLSVDICLLKRTIQNA